MTNESDIRKDQLAFGRLAARAVDSDRVSSEREAFFPVNRRITINKPKPVKKPQGHEALLKMLETAGAEIAVDFLDSDEPMIGIVKHSDKYTISIKPEGKGTTVLFKHAMRGFTPTDKNRTVQE